MFNRLSIVFILAISTVAIPMQDEYNMQKRIPQSYSQAPCINLNENYVIDRESAEGITYELFLSSTCN